MRRVAVDARLVVDGANRGLIRRPAAGFAGIVEIFVLAGVRGGGVEVDQDVLDLGVDVLG